VPLADKMWFVGNRFREDGGRLYNAAQDDYSLPADMQEINRLNCQHVAYRTVSQYPVIVLLGVLSVWSVGSAASGTEFYRAGRRISTRAAWEEGLGYRMRQV
jgi:hypothetical protein